MAITIQEKPYNITRVGQKLIVRATSTNVANDGFKFVFRVTDVNSVAQDFFVSPNPANQGIFDLRVVAQGLMSVDVNNDVLKTDVVFVSDNETRCPLYQYNLTVLEAWLVDDVLTIDEESGVDIQSQNLIPCSYSVMNGYRPNPQNDYGFANFTTSPQQSKSLMLTDRTPNTHKLPTDLPLINIFDRSTIVPIPVRKSELDWGTLQVITEESAEFTSAANLWCRWLLIKSNLDSEVYSEQLTPEGLTHLPAYPANLNEGGLGDVVPADNPNWLYYTIQLFNQNPSNVVGLEAMSALYVFYPVPDNCVNQNVRMCWWSQFKGGFDFFNFSLTNEESVSVERKRYKKIVGNYAGAASGFTFNTSDRGLTETDVSPITTLEINSDWIQEGEFELLRGLVQSKYVWIMDDNGNMTAVVVDDNSFLIERKRDGKLKRAKMKLRYANEIIAF
jgi:hypothetical protein